MKQRRIIRLFILAAAFLILLAVAAILHTRGKNSPCINEVCSSNFSLYSEDGIAYPDYVELYNPSDQPVSCDNWYLSDDRDDLAKLSLAGMTLPPGSFSVIPLHGDTDASDGSFALSRDGETIYFSDENGRILDLVSIPALPYDTAYGRAEDGGKAFSAMTGTPGASNETAQKVSLLRVTAPVFSAGSGFYDEPFSLTLSAAPGCRIYYTTDGSDPDSHSIPYKSPIRIDDASEHDNVYANEDIYPSYVPPENKIDKATVIRAVACDILTGALSEIVTQSYFVGFDHRQEYAGYPVLSLTTDPENLFDPEKGIYTAGKEYEIYRETGGFSGLSDEEVPTSFVDEDGNEWLRYMHTNAFMFRGRTSEREAAASFFDDGHRLAFSQNVGMRIAGNSTRSQGQKSLNLFARDIYGESFFAAPFFDQNNLRKLRLRMGDSPVIFWDPFLQSLADGRAVGIQAYEPCVLFLEGEYWGLYNLQEQYDASYFEDHYGITRDDLWMIKNGDPAYGGDDALSARNAVIDQIMLTDLSDDYLYGIVDEMVDMQSLIDQYCVQLFLDNGDITRDANLIMWRSREQGDGFGDTKWRWVLYDLDDTCYDVENNTFADYHEIEGFYLPGYLYANASFRRQFCLSMMDMINSTFAYGHVHEKLMEQAAAYCSQTIKNQHRFYDPTYSEEDYYTDIQELDDFFRERGEYVAEYMKEDMGLSGEAVPLRISINDTAGGSVRINTIPPEADENWEGLYFTDFPVTLCAEPADGWRFSGWTGDVESESQEIEVLPDAEGTSLHAEFVRAD